MGAVVRTSDTAKASPIDPSQPSAEVALFRAVIQQAISDATLGIFGQGRGRRRKGAPSSARLAHQQDARVWLLGMGRDFRTVCECAMLEPDAVKRVAEKTIYEFDSAYQNARKAINFGGKSATDNGKINTFTCDFVDAETQEKPLTH